MQTSHSPITIGFAIKSHEFLAGGHPPLRDPKGSPMIHRGAAAV
jgi:hypothetical protein